MKSKKISFKEMQKNRELLKFAEKEIEVNSDEKNKLFSEKNEA